MRWVKRRIERGQDKVEGLFGHHEARRNIETEV